MYLIIVDVYRRLQTAIKHYNSASNEYSTTSAVEEDYVVNDDGMWTEMQ